MLSQSERRQYRLRFAAQKSIRYHDYRRAFYTTVASWMFVAGGLSCGHAAAGGMAGGPRAALAAAGLALAAAALLRPCRMDALHSTLYKRFCRHERLFISQLSQDKLDLAERERLDIERDEPPIYLALARHCHNEVLLSEGRVESLQPLGRRHRLLKNLWRFHSLPAGRKEAPC